MRNFKSTLEETTKKLTKAQIIEGLVARNLKGGNGCPPPKRRGIACPPPR